MHKKDLETINVSEDDNEIKPTSGNVSDALTTFSVNPPKSAWGSDSDKENSQ